jgi:hypothetical protein
MITQFQDIDLFLTGAIVIGRVGVLATNPMSPKKSRRGPVDDNAGPNRAELGLSGAFWAH